MSPAKVAATATVSAQACSICSYPRKFIRMREKIGADDRIARWPEYEICPNKDNPKYHPSRKNQMEELDAGLRRPEQDIVREVIERTKLPLGILYQNVESKKTPLDGVAGCLLHYEEKRDGLPMAISVHPDDAEGLDEIDWETEAGKLVAIPIWKSKSHTPGYGYIYLVEAIV